mmetsp:Transcript_52045/g.86294  ORF Transcript_52045/g.86294 Transcript_52045/m.86294 type:complete len:110 (+) Transcript_52045:129-458(+)
MQDPSSMLASGWKFGESLRVQPETSGAGGGDTAGGGDGIQSPLSTDARGSKFDERVSVHPMKRQPKETIAVGSKFAASGSLQPKTVAFGAACIVTLLHALKAAGERGLC